MIFIMSLAAEAVCSGKWFIVFKVLMLNVAMLMFLHLNKLGLGSVAGFLNTGARAQSSAKHSLFTCMEVMPFGYMIWIRVMVIFYLRFYFFVNRCHP